MSDDTIIGADAAGLFARPETAGRRSGPLSIELNSSSEWTASRSSTQVAI